MVPNQPEKVLVISLQGTSPAMFDAESQLPRFIDEAREAQFRLQGRAAAVVLECFISEGGKVYPVN